MHNDHYIFSADELQELPINYRFFREQETESIDELYMDLRFSESDQHYSKSFLNYVLYKPVSGIIFYDIIKSV